VRRAARGLCDATPGDERVRAEARDRGNWRAVKHEQLDERRDDHHRAEHDRGCAGEKWDDEKKRARHFDRARDVAKPLADSDFVEEPNHIRPADELRAANEKENRGDDELDELEENESPALRWVYYTLRSILRDRDRALIEQPSCLIERDRQRDDGQDMKNTDVVEHQSSPEDGTANETREGSRIFPSAGER